MKPEIKISTEAYLKIMLQMEKPYGGNIYLDKLEDGTDYLIADIFSDPYRKDLEYKQFATVRGTELIKLRDGELEKCFGIKDLSIAAKETVISATKRKENGGWVYNFKVGELLLDSKEYPSHSIAKKHYWLSSRKGVFPRLIQLSVSRISKNIDSKQARKYYTQLKKENRAKDFKF